MELGYRLAAQALPFHHPRMSHSSPIVFLAALTALSSVSATGWMADPSFLVDGTDEHGRSPVASTRVSIAPQFVSADDVTAFQALSASAFASPVPDARGIAKAFIQAQLGIDGDTYVVAHFATAADRASGNPDQHVPLVDALMEAFPEHSRHSFFATAADYAGGIMSGGRESDSPITFVKKLWHSRDARSFFAAVGRFLWSRTGPGYVYNTFFGPGNVVETMGEDARELDEAFGVYRIGGFTADYASPWRLSQLVEAFGAPTAFAELPYVTRLNRELDDYWDTNRTNWPVLARYEFVSMARQARDAGELSQDQYILVMRGGAPQVPLDGPLTLAQLRSTARDGSVATRRFDINGYTSTDLIRFVDTDGSEVMYVPGEHPAFVVASNEQALRRWVLARAGNPGTLDALLSHFSTYESQDGTFWTGVRHGLEKIGSGAWDAGDMGIDHANEAIVGDVFEDMRTQVERRLREDARMQASTAWEAWRTTLNRSAALLAPLGFIRPLALTIQGITAAEGAATGIEQGIDGRTTEAREEGVEQAAGTLLYNVPVGAVFGRPDAGHGARDTPSFVPPQRVNGRLGYPLGPLTPRGWRPRQSNRLYRKRNDAPGLWVHAEAERHAVRLPETATLRADGIFIDNGNRYVQIYNRVRIREGRPQTFKLAADRDGYRIVLQDGTHGPLVAKEADGTWQLVFDAHNYLEGSVLAEIVSHDLTRDPRTLHRAAQVLKELGASESQLAELPRSEADSTPASPLLILALGHGFIEALPSRLRDPDAGRWSAAEVRLIAPLIAEQSGRPLALYRHDGRFDVAVSPDGTEHASNALPSSTLGLQRVGDGYVLSADPRARPVRYSTVFEALAASSEGAEREADFRARLADAIDARSTRSLLQRMHRSWIDPMLRTAKERQILRRLSRLRHALVDEHEDLTADQRRWLRQAETNLRQGAIDFTDLLPEIVDEESALLPPGLAHLTLDDAPPPERNGVRRYDQWTENGRHYVRLRHLDGRTQLVETGPDREDGKREILAGRDGVSRGTGRFVVDRDGLWFPDTGVREGLAPVTPGERDEALAAISEKLPATFKAGPAGLERVVDSVPQPLLRFFRTFLASTGVAADGGLELILRHPGSRDPMAFATRIDMEGRPVPDARPQAPLPEAPVSPHADRQLVLPVLDTQQGKSLSPEDIEAHAGLIREERPISAFFKLEMADRHVKALMTTRRVRGMLREDAHVALVGGTPEHVFTMIMPLNADALAFAVPGGSNGQFVGGLQEGTVIVDEMYDITANAADYPSLAMEVARQWEASGVRMKSLKPDGTARESPVEFTRRMLSTPVRSNLWNPLRDPISELDYGKYLRNRYVEGTPVRHAGLDWLGTRKARQDYMAYFAPPYDVIPNGDGQTATNLPAFKIHHLADTAIRMSLRSWSSPVGR